MNIHDMTEISYKNGYEAGIKKFADTLRKECHQDQFGFHYVLIDHITNLESRLLGKQD